MTSFQTPPRHDGQCDVGQSVVWSDRGNAEERKYREINPMDPFRVSALPRFRDKKSGFPFLAKAT
jgi:hypothetical protein